MQTPPINLAPGVEILGSRAEAAVAGCRGRWRTAAGTAGWTRRCVCGGERGRPARAPARAPPSRSGLGGSRLSLLSPPFQQVRARERGRVRGGPARLSRSRLPSSACAPGPRGSAGHCSVQVPAGPREPDLAAARRVRERCSQRRLQVLRAPGGAAPLGLRCLSPSGNAEAVAGGPSWAFPLHSQHLLVFIFIFKEGDDGLRRCTPWNPVCY